MKWNHLKLIISGMIIMLHSQFSIVNCQLPEGEVDYGDHEHYPVYYKETEYTLEHIKELPHDTIYIRDTVFISDIDAFLKKRYNCDLKDFVEKYGAIKTRMDSLNQLSPERLYFNFFLINDSVNKFSNRIIVKEFRVNRDLNPNVFDKFEEEEIYNQMEHPDSVRIEALFRCDGDTITDLFLKNPDAIKRCISAIFTQMQKDSLRPIKGINLYFPDFTFKEKRAMTQFVKSVRMVMDASHDFKFGPNRLTIIFLAKNGIENIDLDFQYCLMQEASEVIFLDAVDTWDEYAVRGHRMKTEDLSKISFLSQIIDHIYIARFYTGDLDITKLNLTDFSEQSIQPVLNADFPENTWEIYLFILVFLITIILSLVVLYYTFIPFSAFVNDNVESILLVAIVVLLEIVILVICVIQHMCKADSFTIVHNNPVLIFALPLLVVFIIPFLNGISKKRRTP